MSVVLGGDDNLDLAARFSRARRMREGILQRLRVEALMDGAFAYTTAEISGRFTLANWLAVGEAAAQSMVRFAALEPEELDEYLARHRHASAGAERGFVDWEHILPADHPRKLALAKSVWRAAGVKDMARLLVFDDDCLAATVGVVRCGAQLSANEKRRLSALVESVSGEMIAAWRLDRSIAPNGDESMLLDPDGRITFASASAESWREVTGLIETAAAAVRVLHKTGGASSVVPWGPVLVKLARLTAGNGKTLYLARMKPATAMERAEDAVLSPVQREVARLAATGATVGEIAATLGRGAETVRSHISAVYRRLGVSTRIELARMLNADAVPDEEDDDTEYSVW